MRFKKGFTLLELLVVIVIIGIASTIIVLKSGPLFLSHRTTLTTAKEITALLELAKRQAIFTMSTIGVRFSATDYSFYQFDDIHLSGWKPLEKIDDFWQPRPIANNLIINLQSQANSDIAKLTKDGFAPQIIITPNGDVTPFKLTLHTAGKNDDIIITNNGNGRISYHVEGK